MNVADFEPRLGEQDHFPTMSFSNCGSTLRRRAFAGHLSHWLPASAIALALIGCGPESSPIDEPIRYDSTAELRARLNEVAQYGDGGSSLGGIPESIEQLTKEDPVKGRKLLEDFQRLNTADSKDARKKIAKEMAEQLQ